MEKILSHLLVKMVYKEDSYYINNSSNINDGFLSEVSLFLIVFFLTQKILILRKNSNLRCHCNMSRYHLKTNKISGRIQIYDG
jgi:hypothetical protein